MKQWGIFDTQNRKWVRSAGRNNYLRFDSEYEAKGFIQLMKDLDSRGKAVYGFVPKKFKK